MQCVLLSIASELKIRYNVRMSQIAVVAISGKQYIVKKGAELVVDQVPYETNASFEVPVLMTYDIEKNVCDIGAPELKTKAKVDVIEHMKGEKIRVAKFKAKVRYRTVNGYRPSLSKLKIVSF